MGNSIIAKVVLCAAIFALAQPAFSTDNSRCLMCHSAATLSKTVEGEEFPLYVHTTDLISSPHGTLSCVDCHVDLKGQPLNHAPAEPAQCLYCHEVHPDVPHSKLKAGDSPGCADCHGSHVILPVADPLSRVASEGSVATCASCHEEAFKKYASSVHGIAKDRKGTPNAGCADCHPVHSREAAGSPRLCGECHGDAYDDWSGSAHANPQGFMEKNSPPTCAHCHGGHTIFSMEDDRFLPNRATSPDFCAECHNDQESMKFYGLKGNSLTSYRESYHGVAHRFGNTEVAVCTDCHTSHRPLAQADPLSSVHENNLPETCGQCHTGTNVNWAKGDMHVHISADKKDAVYYTSTGFKWLTLGTMTALVGHIMLDLFAQTRAWRRRLRRRTDG